MACRPTPFASFIADQLNEPFRLIDVGCSGGIADAWRAFGSNLHAIGFDPNIAECQRMAASENLPNIEYVPGFVGMLGRSPVMTGREKLPWSRIPAARLSYMRTQSIRQAEIAAAATEEKTRLNVWQNTELADPTATIQLPAFLRQREITNVDFIKIDVDGADYEILQDLQNDLTGLGVLGVQVEVNFWGSDSEEDNTLHNVDRLMKRAGFELMDLNHRRYSVGDLPARYTSGIPAETESGRIYQGDAIYIRDLAQPDWARLAAAASSDSLAKLAAIFAAYGLPDCAAEIMVKFRDRLGSRFQLDQALDLLAAQTQGYAADALNYRNYMARFEADDPFFYLSEKVAAPAEEDGDGDIDLSTIAAPTNAQLWRKIRQMERETRELDARWRKHAEEIHRHNVDLDARWQQIVNENNTKWMCEKAEYERMLAAARGAAIG